MKTVYIRANARAVLLAALALVLTLGAGAAQAQVTITSPTANQVLPAGPDYATDVLRDPWDMSNTADIAVDPAQKKGWANLAVSGGLAGGTLAAVNGANNGSHINFLERSYWGIINPGRTGARFPIASGVYTKLAFKMSSTGDNAQQGRIYWFHKDLGDPAGDGSGLRYVNATPSAAMPNGNNIFEVDLTASLLAGEPWTAADVRGFSIYPNSSAVGYQVQFDWVRLTTGDAHPASPAQSIVWSGGANANIDVLDSGNTVLRVATNTKSGYSWHYGSLPPGAYNLRVTPNGGTAVTTPFRINAPPSLTITDPDASGGEDFATAVLGNPWDMNDSADFRFDGTIVDHLIARGVSGGTFNGTSDGAAVATSQDGIPVGDPQVYLLSGNGVIDTSRYRYLTFGLQVDGAYDLLRGSVARVFWGSDPSSVSGAPYHLTTSKDIITWAGMNTFTIDLGALSTAPNGGLETAGTATAWTASNVRHLRIDPHEFAEQRGFHLDGVKLAAMDETASGAFTIHFATSDPDADPLSLALYYDTDTNAQNGKTLISSAVSAGSGQYVWNTASVPAGVYYIYAESSDGRNAVGAYSTGPVRVSTFVPPSDPLMSLDFPGNGSTVGQPFQISGWAFDRAATSGTGVDFVHVYAYPNPGSGQAALFLGAATYGQSRGDVGAAFGSRFTNTGYSLQVNGLPAGAYQLAVYAHSAVSGAYQLRTITLTVAGPLMSIDFPAPGVARAQPFTLSGWAFDSAGAGTGVDTLHVWAYPNPGSGQAAIFVGVAQYGQRRDDVGAAYGARFTNSGFSIQVKGLAPKVYQFVVFSHSTATGTFNTSRSVTLPVQNAPAMALDTPGAGNVTRTFTIKGWAIDFAAASGTGVDAIHVYAYKAGSTVAQPLGVATYGGARGDVAAAFGNAQFTASAYSLNVTSLTTGTWDLVVYAHSTVSGAFDNWRTVRVNVP